MMMQPIDRTVKPLDIGPSPTGHTRRARPTSGFGPDYRI